MSVDYPPQLAPGYGVSGRPDSGLTNYAHDTYPGSVSSLSNFGQTALVRQLPFPENFDLGLGHNTHNDGWPDLLDPRQTHESPSQWDFGTTGAAPDPDHQPVFSEQNSGGPISSFNFAPITNWNGIVSLGDTWTWTGDVEETAKSTQTSDRNYGSGNDP